MGSPISPHTSTLYMEESKVKALNYAPHTPCLWLRYADDTFVSQDAVHSQKLLQHINTQDLHTKFTMEELDQGGSLPFLDTLVSPGPNSTSTTTVYRKPKHTDQYLHCDSNHFIGAKHSVFNTLPYKAKVVSTKQQSLHRELKHIKKAIQACSFPPWALNHLQHKFNCKHNINNGQDSMVNQLNKKNKWNKQQKHQQQEHLYSGTLYTGLREKFKRACNNKGILVNLKGTNTIKTLLITSKDRHYKLQRSGVIYKFKCPHIHYP